MSYVYHMFTTIKKTPMIYNNDHLKGVIVSNINQPL